MTADPRMKGVAILATSGLLLVGVVLVLFYGVSGSSSRSEAFTFTVWFSVVQVLLLFASLIYTAVKDGRPGSVIPVNSATVVATFLYNVTAVLTMILFIQFLLPYYSSPSTYYAICFAEFGVAAAYVVMLQLVAVAHQVGHAEAAQSKATIDSLVKMCDVVSSNATSAGWVLDMRQCSEVIRFSEGLRHDPALSSEVDRLLGELESLTNSAPQEPALGEAKKLIRGIEALARRRN